jgi:hypothetical protein
MAVRIRNSHEIPRHYRESFRDYNHTEILAPNSPAVWVQTTRAGLAAEELC